MATGFLRKHPGVQPSRRESLKNYTVYELLFEVVARLREGGLATASTRQLLIVGRACTEELAIRVMKKEGDDGSR